MTIHYSMNAEELKLYNVTDTSIGKNGSLKAHKRVPFYSIEDFDDLFWFHALNV
jgi:hypothetical protein